MTAPTEELVESKTCTGCHEDKPLGEFPSHPNGHLGLDSKCRKCKNGARKPTAKRVIRNRARQRATAELVKLHEDEFHQLLEAHTRYVADEIDMLRVAAAAERDDDTHLPRLKRGPRAAGEDVLDRLDVARCPHCAESHDNGHRCTACGARPADFTAEGDPIELGDLEHEAARATEECRGCDAWTPGQILSPRLLCDTCEARTNTMEVSA